MTSNRPLLTPSGKPRRPPTPPAEPSQASLQRRAERVSQRWEDLLDDFELPCPLCRGTMEFQGVTSDRLYEFAEGEPGVVHPIDVLPFSFICSHCGYSVEFDGELFNPAYLARLKAAQPERIAQLMIRDFRVMVPLRGDERSDTLLHLATALAGYQHGDVLVLNAAHTTEVADRLDDRLRQFQPAIGDPAPVNSIRSSWRDLARGVAEAVVRQRCDLMLISGKGWSKSGDGGVGHVVDDTLREGVCDVAIVYDRGLGEVNRVLLATAGGPNARTATPFAAALARAYEAELHVLTVVSPTDPNPRETGQARISETLADTQTDDIRLQRRVLTGENAVETIVSESGEYDLLVLGASPRTWRGKIPLNTPSAVMVRNASVTSIVVLARGGGRKSWLARLLGQG
jgi:nucleotide-binding universal stress UspA family protein